MEKLEIIKTDFLQFTTYNGHEIRSFQYLEVKEPRAVSSRVLRIFTALDGETWEIKKFEKSEYFCVSLAEIKAWDLSRAKENVKKYSWKILKK